MLRILRCAAMVLFAAAGACAQEFRLFPASAPGPRHRSPFDAGGDAAFRVVDLEGPFAWGEEDETGFGPGIETRDDPAGLPRPAAAPLPRSQCVLLQCVRTSPEPAAPPKKLFTTPVTLWTAAGLLGGVAVGVKGPLYSRGHGFRFTDEGFFQTWTYGGGADKCSHFVVSGNVAALLDDAYALNGLTPDQSFVLSFATTLAAGALVEVGDGLTPYGFSAQDLTADALGALTGALVKRNRLDDLIGLRAGKVPTTIPRAVVGDRVFSGINYATEIYTADLKLAGLEKHLHFQPGIARFLLISFAFMAKGYGYDPPLPERYQELGLEVGLNFPEILKTVGVRDTTWWGDLLLRTFDFFRIPFTQVGVYYDLANQKWFGPGAPNHFH